MKARKFEIMEDYQKKEIIKVINEEKAQSSKENERIFLSVIKYLFYFFGSFAFLAIIGAVLYLCR